MASTTIDINWSRLGVGAAVGFVVGWFLFGFFTALLLAVIVMFFTGIIKVK